MQSSSQQPAGVDLESLHTFLQFSVCLSRIFRDGYLQHFDGWIFSSKSSSQSSGKSSEAKSY